MSKELASEAAWRAGWDPDDQTKNWDGRAVFYNRKNPLYLRWENERKRGASKFCGSLLFGPRYGPQPDPNAPNPYYKPARAARAYVKTSSSDDFGSGAEEYAPQKGQFKGVHIEENDDLKEYHQLLFEAVQENGDPYSRITPDIVRALLMYSGHPVESENEIKPEGLNYYEYKELEHDLVEPALDEPANLAKAFAIFNPPGPTVDRKMLYLVMTLFGDNPITEAQADALFPILFAKGDECDTVATQFLAPGDDTFIAPFIREGASPPVNPN